MKLTYETINLLMLLIPGLISSSIYGGLRRKEFSNSSSFEKIVDSLIFTFLVYIAVNLSYSWEPLAQAIKNGSEVTYRLSNDKVLILLTLSYALLIPIAWSAITHHDLHMKVLRWLKLTDRTSRDTAWDDVFINEKRFITIHLKDERRLTGWPLYYSNNPDEGFIYLSQVAWIGEDNDYIESQSHGILISKESIDLIEFMTNPDEESSQNE